MLPKVSIIIPTYNVESYITRCLESCINQTLSDIEILIIDDCGNDKSIDIAKSFAKKDKRIRIIHNPKNLGTFHARAKGIYFAQAQFCMFADPDDYFLPTACESAYHLITKNQADIGHLEFDYYPKTIKRIKPIVYNGRLESASMRRFLNNTNNTQSLCDKIIKTQILRTALSKLDFVNKPLLMLEDGLLVLVASLQSRTYIGKREIIYHYCYNPHSITKNKDIENFYKKLHHSIYLLEITQILKEMYPNDRMIIEKYQHKVASTLMIETRDYSHTELYNAMIQLAKFHFDKNFDFPTYLKSSILSLRYAFRWQNLIRLCAYIVSFGNLRL